ncbi:Histidine Protein Methyltransferase 1 [Manis pentadactyla]|nr:Histidine Protein Methyltransferase 1 [Manis pentadactyla]
MHTIRLGREFGFNSDGECAILFQDYSDERVISMVMVELQATETLALRKELGSGSDVTGSARWWIRLMMKVKCQILAPVLGLALVVRIQCWVNILYSPWFPETLALRKELGSGSDVTGVQDGGSGLWIQCWVNILYSPWFPETLALRKELGSGSDVTGSARWWIRLMMKVKCQILAPELELALVVRPRTQC